MRYLLLLATWLLALSAPAAPLPADTAAPRLTRTGLPLGNAWRYHVGDNPAWARPDFDASAWDTLNPTRPGRELPPATRAGVY